MQSFETTIYSHIIIQIYQSHLKQIASDSDTAMNSWVSSKQRWCKNQRYCNIFHVFFWNTKTAMKLIIFITANVMSDRKDLVVPMQAVIKCLLLCNIFNMKCKNMHWISWCGTITQKVIFLKILKVHQFWQYLSFAAIC